MYYVSFRICNGPVETCYFLIFSDNLKYSKIQVGNDSSISTQNICSHITYTGPIITVQCNSVHPVRYLSVVAASSVLSLHLCEVEVEGYSTRGKLECWQYA